MYAQLARITVETKDLYFRLAENLCEDGSLIAYTSYTPPLPEIHPCSNEPFQRHICEEKLPWELGSNARLRSVGRQQNL